jgi:hypothetical protein
MGELMNDTPLGRRDFLRLSAQTAGAIGLGQVASALGRDHAAAGATGAEKQGLGGEPWYRRALRWGQTNITERDPVRYDIAWWRDYWKRTAIQGVIINAGGIVAYYPSRFPLQHQAEFLDGRDLYGELAQAAHEDGLVVLARMDSNRTSEDFLRAHPDWFARMRSGDPYRVADKFVTCINSPYYEAYLPDVMREIIERTHPEGFADNSWSGLSRDAICYCENCARKFRDKTGFEIPEQKDWNAAVYRQWIQWNYERRTELWDLNNRVTRAAGGPHCLWLGMNGSSITAQSHSFRDFREIGRRSEILLLDQQARADVNGFQQNGDAGKLVHGLLGWDKVIIESMALYQLSATPGSLYRLSAKPEPEARVWMIEGIAGGIGPWWHIVGAYHDDRRMYRTPERVFQWHQQHQQYLARRRPVVTVGVVWSQRNADYYGRDDAATTVDAPYRGFTEALIRGRIPYLPVHASDIAEQAGDFAVLILPNVGALSDSEGEAIRQFAQRGGAVIATGATSLYDEWGDARPDFALADLFGVHAPAGEFGRKLPEQVQSYLRLTPELRGKAWGPKLPDDPLSGTRHPVLSGFEDTDIIPFGGQLENLRLDNNVTVPLTFVPPIPAFPPETAWMRQPTTNIAGLVINAFGKARVAFLPADIDRRYAQNNLPDHGNLLANIVRWAAGDSMGFELQGPGLIDCHVYHQPGHMIVHLVNLTSEGSWRAPVHELIPVGPFKLRMKLAEDVSGRESKCLVSGATPFVALRNRWASLDVQPILDHEVLVIS